MLTDLEIATSAEILEINEIAKKVNISSDELECYGKYKAKINLKSDISISLIGFIDKIMMDEEGKYAYVVDYKTGKPEISNLRIIRAISSIVSSA